MIFLLVFLMAVVPYIIGTALIMIFGNRKRGPVVRWAVGSLALLAAFFMCLLVALRLDFSLEELSKSYEIVAEAVFAGAVPVFLYAVKNKRFSIPRLNRKMLVWVIPGAIIGLFSVFLLEPVYVNDITVETVRTTLYSGQLYEVSALLGTTMEAGLPIFNKLEILPMLYAVICSEFGVDVSILTHYMIPLAAIIVNLAIMWEMSAVLVEKEEDRNIFMIFHLLILVAGTYLPEVAIPVTVGEPLLMQGYTGWAIAYGVVIPAFILMFMDKRMILCGFVSFPILGLIRYDRVFFAFKEFFTSYHLANTAGKLFILYVLALCWWHIRRKKPVKIHPAALISGSALVSATLTFAYDRIGRRKSFVAACGIAIMACVYFMPFGGTTLTMTSDSINFERVTKDKSDVTIWAPNEVISVARRNTAAVKTVYARDYYEKLLDGVNYEPISEEQKELCYIMEVINLYMDSYVEDLAVPIIAENAALNGVDVVMLPTGNYSDRINVALAKRGFNYSEEYNDYLVMRRYE